MHVTLEYWRDGKWYVGRILEVPSVFSQGKTIEELIENVRDAYEMMMEMESCPGGKANRIGIELEVPLATHATYQTA